MPEYKKRKNHRFSGKKNPKTEVNSLKIPMRPSRSKANVSFENETKVVKGGKLVRKQKTKVFVMVIIIAAVIYTLFSILLPISIGENVTNLVARIGTGSYPGELYGSGTLDCVSNGSYYYVLTDTHFTAFSNSGKMIFSHSHGYSHPVLSTSATRSLIFDQGGYELTVANLKKTTNTLKTKYSIINAAISRSGSYVVATRSNSYASTVTAYNKNGKSVYVWNSAKDIINNVAISPSGDKIAVTTINATAGQYVTKLMIFKFDSADPVYTCDLSGNIPLMLQNSASGFSVMTPKSYSYIKWSNYEKTDVQTENNFAFYRQSSDRILLVSNRSGNTADNRIILLSRYGKKLSEFKFEHSISDIEVTGNHIYCISDTAVYIFNKDGEILKTGKCKYGCERFAIIGSNSVAVVSDSAVEKFIIESGK